MKCIEIIIEINMRRYITIHGNMPPHDITPQIPPQQKESSSAERKKNISRRLSEERRRHEVREVRQRLGIDAEGERQGDAHEDAGAKCARDLYGLFRAFAEVHRLDDEQVVVDRDHRHDEADEGEPQAALIDDRREEVELPGEARRRRDARHREQRNRHDGGEDGRSSRESRDVRHVGLAALRLDGGQHGESADVRKGVEREVEEQRLHARRIRRDDADEHVADLRDGRICEHALHVVLHDRHDVAADHRDGGENGQKREPHAAQRREYRQDEAQEHGESRRLRPHGEERGDRRGRSLVDVGRPHVERYHRQLEEDAGKDERHADDAERREELRAAHDRRKAQAARRAVDEADAEEEDRGRRRAQDEVLDRRLARKRIALAESDEHIEGDRHKLQPDVKREEVVRRSHDAHAEHGEDEDRVELRTRTQKPFNIVARKEHDERCAQNEELLEEDGVIVHDVKPRVEGRRLAAPIKGKAVGEEREKRDDRDRRETRARFLLRQQHAHRQEEQGERKKTKLHADC